MKAASFKDVSCMSGENIAYLDRLGAYIEASPGTLVDKFENFPKFTPRTSIARFLARYEIFKRVLNVQGSIVECGVLFGGGLMTWMQLSSILEPANHQRRIIGFDTFAGFPSVSKEDESVRSNPLRKKGELSVAGVKQDLEECVKLYDMMRYFSHINKMELIEGDICHTAHKYVDDNPYLIVSLLYLDLDLYEPTKNAIKIFLPRIPKGGIIAFDESNSSLWPGETQAIIETVGINNLKLERFQFGTGISYALIQ